MIIIKKLKYALLSIFSRFESYKSVQIYFNKLINNDPKSRAMLIFLKTHIIESIKLRGVTTYLGLIQFEFYEREQFKYGVSLSEDLFSEDPALVSDALEKLRENLLYEISTSMHCFSSTGEFYYVNVDDFVYTVKNSKRCISIEVKILYGVRLLLADTYRFLDFININWIYSDFFGVYNTFQPIDLLNFTDYGLLNNYWLPWADKNLSHHYFSLLFYKNDTLLESDHITSQYNWKLSSLYDEGAEEFKNYIKFDDCISSNVGGTKLSFCAVNKNVLVGDKLYYHIAQLAKAQGFIDYNANKKNQPELNVFMLLNLLKLDFCLNRIFILIEPSNFNNDKVSQNYYDQRLRNELLWEHYYVEEEKTKEFTKENRIIWLKKNCYFIKGKDDLKREIKAALLRMQSEFFISLSHQVSFMALKQLIYQYGDEVLYKCLDNPEQFLPIIITDIEPENIDKFFD
jgi:hypothetical protein